VRGTIRDAPQYREYTGKATALMQKYAPFLMTGTYRDTDHFTQSSAEVDARSFVAGNRLAVVLTQSHLAKTSTDLTVAGYRLVKHGGIGEYTVEASSGPVRVGLTRDALALVVFEKR
jgi:hypothetical protein